jgi:phage-related protein
MGALIPAAGIAGLTAMGKKAIDAADNLNDLSQRTGVAVPILSKFGAAAEDSGSSIDEVAKSMGRLSKGIVDPASKTNEALKAIGISSTDAQGKIRSVDSIMLDLADKFAKMPDGAEKTALAMELFGKSGMNLIPMLNGGREALSQYSATIDTEMAQAADKFNDSLNAIARSVAGPFNQAITALLPFITQMANGIAGLATWFSGLPAPLQTIIAAVGALTLAFVALAPAISAIITIGGAIGAAFAGGTIFATLAGTLGAVVPVLTAIGGALGGLLPILAGVFSGPVGWIALAVAAGVAIYAFRDQIGQAFQAIGKFLQDAAQGFQLVFIDPVIQGFQAVVEFVNVNFVQPISEAISGLVQSIANTFKAVTDAITAPFKAAFESVRGIVNQILNGIGSAIGSVVGAINGVIRGANSALAALKLPQIPMLPMPSIPQFAEGGVVSGPTLAMVGEGGEPEYIVPQSKANAFAANWMAGVRGPAAIPRFAEGGMVIPGGASVSIQTGPVTQMDGTNFVTTEDLSAAVQAGVNQTLNLLAGDSSVRRSLGLT